MAYSDGLGKPGLTNTLTPFSHRAAGEEWACFPGVIGFFSLLNDIRYCLTSWLIGASYHLLLVAILDVYLTWYKKATDWSLRSILFAFSQISLHFFFLPSLTSWPHRWSLDFCLTSWALVSWSPTGWLAFLHALLFSDCDCQGHFVTSYNPLYQIPPWVLSQKIDTESAMLQLLLLFLWHVPGSRNRFLPCLPVSTPLPCTAVLFTRCIAYPFAPTPGLPDSFLNVPSHFFGICPHCANCALRGWSPVEGEPQSLDPKTPSFHAKLLMS